ncbi:MAG: nicotinate-nucleotide diphosphorylase (carboxylating), partial [Oscillospiraceae bacterium]
MALPQFYVDDLIKNAIKEDINYVDVTTDFLIEENAISDAYMVSKDDGVLAGIDIATRVFTLLDEKITFEILKKDGDVIQKGDIIL